VSLNIELREKYIDEPLKFMGSEEELDTAIKSLSVLSNAPNLLGLFIKSGSTETLMSLVAHENTDIADEAIKVIGELLDIEGSDVSEEDVEDITKFGHYLVASENLGSVIVTFLQQKLKSDELDTEAVADALRIIEILIAFEQSDLFVKAFLQTDLVSWLIGSLNDSRHVPTAIRNNCAELLASILVHFPAVFSQNMAKDSSNIDRLLQAIATIRGKKIKKYSDEEGFFKDMFDILRISVRNDEANAQFLKNEGTDLMLILIKDAQYNWIVEEAFKVLVETLKGSDRLESAVNLIKSGGLKYLFKTFYSESSSNSKKKKKGETSLRQELGVQIVSLLLRWLPLDSDERKRVIKKFVVNKFEKLHQFLQIRDELKESVAAEEAKQREERDQDNDDKEDDLRHFANEIELEEQLSKAGKDQLQVMNVILAWLIVEYPELLDIVKASRKAEIVANLKEQIELLNNFTGDEKDESFEQREAKLDLDLISTLYHELM
jgi:beta-catenin-like protein 1